MREAIAQKILAHGLAHLVFANHFFQREKNRRRLAVADASVGTAARELPGKPSQRIVVGRLEVGGPLFLRFAHLSKRKIQERRFLSVECVHYFHFHVAVDAFVEPCFLELVGCYHAVPILVTELVRDYDFWKECALGYKPSSVRCY